MNTNKFTGTLRRLYTGFAVSAILALLICFYYYYISNKEKKIQERNFRVLHSIEENFERRIRDIRDIRQTVIGKLKTCVDCIDNNGNINIKSVKEALKNDLLLIYSDTSTAYNRDWEIIYEGKKSLISFYISTKELNENTRLVYYIQIKAEIDILASVLRYDVFPSYILKDKRGVAYNTCPELCEFTINDSLAKNDYMDELQIGSGNFYVFCHPFSLGTDKGVYLCGIMPSQQYAREKYSVPGNFLLTLILLLLVIFLAFPFIKSFLISAEETLNVGDILLALLSLFLLCYMYVFMHMFTYTVYRDGKDKGAMLQNTNDNIKTSFLSELKMVRQQLNRYDSIYSVDYAARRSKAGNLDKPYIYSDFTRVFWLDHEGTQICEWIKEKSPFTIPPNYRDRDYFKAVVKKALWYPENAKHDKIYLEPLYSRNDGSFRAVMSKNSINDTLIAAISVDMNSVINTVHPKEVNFCLLNNKGEILFTSAGNEHLNESLIEECDNSKELRTAINARANTFFDKPFMGNDCTFYISPVDSLPLYMVTFANNGMSGDTQLQVCIFTSLFILAILILFTFVITFLVILKGGNKNRIIKRTFLDLSWLYPSSNYSYRDFGGIFYNILLIIALFFCSYIYRNEPFTLIFLLLINAAGTTAAFCYARLDVNPSRRKWFWGVLILFFIICNIFLYTVGAFNNAITPISFIFYELFLSWVIYQLRTMRFCEKDFPVFANESKHPVYAEILKKKKNPLQNFIIEKQEIFSKWSGSKFHHQYTFMLVTWFSLIVLLPTVFLYRYFYREENENRIKSIQIDIARQWYDKNAYRLDGKANPVKKADSSNTKCYVGYFYKTKFMDDTSCNIEPDLQEIMFHDFLNHFRFPINLKDDGSNEALPGKSDKTIRFCRDDVRIMLQYQNLLNHPESNEKNTMVIESTLPHFPIPPVKSYLPFIIYFVAPFFFLLLLYYVIRFFLSRFFLFDVLPSIKPDIEGFNTRFLNKYNKETFKLMLLGVNASGKKDLIREAVSFIYDEQNKDKPEGEEKMNERKLFISSHILTYDLAEIDQAIIDFKGKEHNKGEIVLLSHFEHNLAEKDANDKKFMLIAKIFQLKETQPHLVILSTIHPSVFLNNLKAKTDLDSFKAEDYINQQDYYNWTGLLSTFEIYTQAYGERRALESLSTGPDNMKTYTSNKTKYLYYLSIWNSLERIEKFVLYDLAKDNLVNYRNREALYSLYCKGLVVQNDIPGLMNDEFNTFINSEIKEEDVELEKRQHGKGSAWNTFRIPFLIILAAVLFFVFITQQETFTKLMATLMAFAGSIPVLVKLLSFTQGTKAG